MRRKTPHELTAMHSIVIDKKWRLSKVIYRHGAIERFVGPRNHRAQAIVSLCQ